MKTVTAQEFLDGFSKLQKSLVPGESIGITDHGKRIGMFMKEPRRRVRLPNFAKLAKENSYGPEIGDKLLKRILEDEALS
jgi:hypothetical protein